MLLSAIAPVTLLAFPYADLAWHTLPACLTDNYYGLFNQHAVFKPTEPTCVDDSTKFLATSPPLHVSLYNLDDRQLVWMHESAIDQSLRTPDYDAEVKEFFDWLSLNIYLVSPPANQRHDMLRYRTVDLSVTPAFFVSPLGDNNATSLLVTVPNDDTAHALSSLLPRYWKSSLIPSTPISYVPVPDTAIHRIRDLLATVRFNPVVASIVNGMTVDTLRQDIRYLTNEDGESGIISRHSFAAGSRVAAAWLKETFEQTGAKCELRPFTAGFAPNVVCKYTSVVDAETAPIVLISGHYDSRGSFGSSRAPGGNDDGSGTISLLSIARRIKEVGVKFHSNVELVAFAGEEQGLYGSKAYARELRQQGANVTLMIQADMLAYHALNEPPQLGLPMYIGTTEVADLVTKMATLYSPELTVGYTAACCSDHQSFHEQGFPATQVFERAGPIADPMYHNSGDLSDRPGYDFDQVRYISRVQFATLLHTAGFELPEPEDFDYGFVPQIPL